MKKEAEIVILGGGIMGATIAYNLAKRGKEVVVIEKDEFCGGTSGTSAALLWIQDKQPEHYLKMAIDSIKAYDTFEEELGSKIEYKRTGAIELLRNEKEFSWGMRLAEAQNKAGYDVTHLSPEETVKKEPIVNPQVLGSLYSKLDGQVNPFLLVNAFLKAAKRSGAEVYTFTEVKDFSVKGSVIKEVITNKGKIKPKIVVCAAGIYSKAIAKLLGIKVPIHPERGFFLVTERMPPVLNHVVTGARQDASGNILLGLIQDPTAEIDRKMYIYGMRLAAKDAFRDFPGIRGVNVIRSFTGIRCLPDDMLPILGPTRKISNFWIAVTHHAFTMCGSLGPMAAELICGERDTKSIPYYAYDRFL
ncbi:MAG: NAD(P)/FAD-dependent oxidoreductase [Tepidanaerobacteraceae bacterium]|jgi:glycine/D-amino acid oxidase-like deaminating enzyme